MPQTFLVLRCFSCKTFQVQQKKKNNKWTCRICQSKQSVQRVFCSGAAKACRTAVQTLNLNQGQAIEQAKEAAYVHLHTLNHDAVPESVHVAPSQSRWAAFGLQSNENIDEAPECEVADPDTDSSAFTTRIDPRPKRSKRKIRQKTDMDDNYVSTSTSNITRGTATAVDSWEPNHVRNKARRGSSINDRSKAGHERDAIPKRDAVHPREPKTPDKINVALAAPEQTARSPNHADQTCNTTFKHASGRSHQDVELDSESAKASNQSVPAKRSRQQLLELLQRNVNPSSKASPPRQTGPILTTAAAWSSNEEQSRLSIPSHGTTSRLQTAVNNPTIKPAASMSRHSGPSFENVASSRIMHRAIAGSDSITTRPNLHSKATPNTGLHSAVIEARGSSMKHAPAKSTLHALNGQVNHDNRHVKTVGLGQHVLQGSHQPNWAQFARPASDSDDDDYEDA
eukprot:TRINITY_DN6427_c0_g1_i2.p1 TRINITY_DN6427_c0_g1~~TRINITY_DN6427_c0_g1_i2.p1  ORF type:complete len:454 (+),score=62.64 TRINITY_DN6427_c0_g1_i2:77-1438(+)